MRRLCLLLIALFVLSGCARQPVDPATQPLTGTEGVVLTNTYTPADVFEDEQFELTYELENRGLIGVSPIQPGILIPNWDALYLQYDGSLSSFPEDYFHLYPRTRYSAGERTFVTLFFTAKALQRNSQRITTPVLLSLCYPYQSNITTQVCIERERHVDPGAIACTNRPVSPASVGAPISVKSVEVRNQRVELGGDEFGIAPQFRILLTNHGEGVPSVTACGDSEANLNTARVRAFLLNEPLECGVDSDEATVRFTRGEAFVSCVLPEDAAITRGQGNFISLLSLEVEYTYRETERTEVTVRHE